MDERYLPRAPAAGNPAGSEVAATAQLPTVWGDAPDAQPTDVARDPGQGRTRVNERPPDERPAGERLAAARARVEAYGERVPTPIRSTVAVLMATYEAWRKDRTIRLGAGLAYYGLFSLASVFSISLWMVQVLSSRSEVENFLAEALENSLGDQAPDAANATANMLDQVAGEQLGLVGLASLLITGSLWASAYSLDAGVAVLAVTTADAHPCSPSFTPFQKLS